MQCQGRLPETSRKDVARFQLRIYLAGQHPQRGGHRNQLLGVVAAIQRRTSLPR